MRRYFLFRVTLLALLGTTAPLALAAPRDIALEKIQPYLRLFPDADTNRDGKLSLEEARAYRQKIMGPRDSDGPPPAEPGRGMLPTPTHADVKYGPHERNVLDLWLPPSTQSTALVVFIHGGGFINGDKSKAPPAAIEQCLKAGMAFMSVNYRFRSHAPIQDILRDTARAIQYVRLHAKEYNIDPQRIAAFGASAGAGASLWLAVHDDLADPQSPDPVLRQSSRLLAAGCYNGQASYDITEWETLIGAAQKEWMRTDSEDFAFYHFTSHDDFKTPAGQKILADCSMYRQISPDDPPLFMFCSQPGGEPSNRNHMLHHPRHAEVIKARCDARGVRCEINIPLQAGTTAPPPSIQEGYRLIVDFLFQQLRGTP